MSGLIKKNTPDGFGTYLYWSTDLGHQFLGQYVRSLNRNGYDALRVISKPKNTAYDQKMFFLTAQEAEDWVLEPVAVRRIRGTLV